MGQRTYSFDIEMLFKSFGLVAASGAAQVDGADRIVDVGDARFEAVMVIDVSAIEIASNNEEFDVVIQGSNSATFADTIENLAILNLGATEVRQGGAQDSTVGRYELPFCNEQDSVIYRYLRIYTVVAGTVATGINYQAFAGEKY